MCPLPIMLLSLSSGFPPLALLRIFSFQTQALASVGLGLPADGARLVHPKRKEHLSEEEWTVAEYMLSSGDELFLLPSPKPKPPADRKA